MAVTISSFPRAISRAEAAGAPVADRARTAYVVFLVFILAVYASVAQLIPPLAAIAPGKVLIAFAAAALLWSVVLCGRRFRLAAVAGGGAPYLFFVLVLASPAWSLAPETTLDAVGESIKYLVAFVLAANVLDTKLRIRRAMSVIVLASLFPAIGALHSYLTGEHLVEGRGAWLGVFHNPNFLAYHLVVSTPLAFALRDSVPSYARAGSLIRFGWLVTVGVFAAAVLVTGSRGGFLGFGAVVLLWMLRGLARGRIAFGAAAAVAIALLMTPGGPWSREDTQATLAGRVDLSAKGRIDAWRTALNAIEARPFGGVGAGAFVEAYERYAPGDAGPKRTTHNSFAMVAAELGLPALGFFVIALAGSFFGLGRMTRRSGPRFSALARGTQTALFGFIVCSLTGGYAFTWPLYFILGLSAAICLRPDAANP